MIYLKSIKFHKSYTMDTKAANQTLQNILSSCDRAPNTVPFDKILLRQKAHTAVFMFGITLSICLFMLVLVVPYFTL